MFLALALAASSLPADGGPDAVRAQRQARATVRIVRPAIIRFDSENARGDATLRVAVRHDAQGRQTTFRLTEFL